jgi:hypothetical protein
MYFNFFNILLYFLFYFSKFFNDQAKRPHLPFSRTVLSVLQSCIKIAMHNFLVYK